MFFLFCVLTLIGGVRIQYFFYGWIHIISFFAFNVIFSSINTFFHRTQLILLELLKSCKLLMLLFFKFSKILLFCVIFFLILCFYFSPKIIVLHFSKVLQGSRSLYLCSIFSLDFIFYKKNIYLESWEQNLTYIFYI